MAVPQALPLLMAVPQALVIGMAVPQALALVMLLTQNTRLTSGSFCSDPSATSDRVGVKDWGRGLG